MPPEQIQSRPLKETICAARHGVRIAELTLILMPGRNYVHLKIGYRGRLLHQVLARQIIAAPPDHFHQHLRPDVTQQCSWIFGVFFGRPLLHEAEVVLHRRIVRPFRVPGNFRQIEVTMPVEASKPADFRVVDGCDDVGKITWSGFQPISCALRIACAVNFGVVA